MPVRGTSNYVWFTEQPIGTGATGNVFYGRHKRLGDVCAIKVFGEHSRSSAMDARTRELELIRKSEHKNIAKLLCIEQETHTKENVLVMELCSEGSVYDMLQRPENFYGFSESGFLVFMQDFVSGLEFLQKNGITHRNVEPGNILCSVGEDERPVYKLTDFGSTRKEQRDMESISLNRVSEEYLHPDVYGYVIMGKERQGYTAVTDLWSIGATLFHVATGMVPFQPYDGRQNKETMFRILSEKKYEYISGVQKERNGDITWSKELPSTCRLSVSLKRQLIPVFVGTLQRDPQHQWSFAKFLEFCQKFVSLQRICFFSGLSLQSCPLYVPKLSSKDVIKKELESVTNVPSGDQLWLYNNTDLSNSSEFSDLFSTTEDKFCILWPKIERAKLNKLNNDIFLTVPVCNLSSGVLATDVSWSREVCAQIIHYSEALKSLLKSQSVFILVKESLCKINKNRLKCFRLMFNEEKETFKSLHLTGDMLFGKASEGGGASSSVPVSNEQLMIGKLERLERHIMSQFKDFDEYLLSDHAQQACDCELKRCEAKLDTYVNQAKNTYEQFRKDKDRTLSYNEEQIHKYDRVSINGTSNPSEKDQVIPEISQTETARQTMEEMLTGRQVYLIKLNEVLKKSIRLLNDHCLIHTTDQYRKLIEWYSDEFRRSSDQLAHIEKDLKKFKNVCSEVFASIEKNFQNLSSSFNESASASSLSGSGMQFSELCPTPTAKIPAHLLKAHMDLICLSQQENSHMQKDIENHLKEMDDLLNKLQGISSGDMDIT